MQSSMLYQYGNNGPSRMNPRMPNSKKENEEDIGNGSTYADLLDDNTSISTGLLSSLIDNKLRTPMDLIQADFPSTPSSVYSNRVLENKLKEGNNAGSGSSTSEDDRSPNEVPANLTNSGTSANSASSKEEGISSASSASSLDQATKSFQQLYVNAPVW